MITFIKRSVVLLFVAASLAIGCNTAYGCGKDVQNASEGVPNGTK